MLGKERICKSSFHLAYMMSYLALELNSGGLCIVIMMDDGRMDGK